MIGHTLGPYQVLSKLGEGGMGQVYRARDTKLNRDVAIKILPDAVAHDQDRVARFTREAQALAALNHPNIAQIYGTGEEPSPDPGSRVPDPGIVSYLVMELVDGEDLSAVVARGPIPLAEALPIARQIADALEAAHEQGIIHRDLKPANIKVRDDGTVKVLDFGLAKALDPAGASGSDAAMNSPTMTARATAMGMILGTAAYMAPEQARGKPVDRRADIWAFGVVLYEMLTGQRAFKGDDVSDVLASVLRSDPDWGVVPAHVPPSVARLLRRCLEKDPKRRLSAIGDARFDLDDTTEQAADPPRQAAPASPGVARRALPWLTVAALAAIVAIQWAAGRTPPAPATPFRFPVELPVGVVPTRVPSVLVTSDGSRIYYTAAKDGVSPVFTQKLGELSATAMPGTEGANRPFLSPDGRWMAFSKGQSLQKMPVDGGKPVEIGRTSWGGGSWGLDNRIVYPRSYQEGLWEVDAAGGPETMLTSPDRDRGELAHWWPQVLPDGDRIIFTAYRATGDSTVEVFSRASKTRTVLVKDAVCGRYVAPGYLVYLREESLFAVRLDPATMRPSGGAVPILSDVAEAHGDGYGAFDIADNGTLVHLPASSFDAERELVFVSRTGAAQLALPIADRYDHPSLSPDGTRIAVDLKPRGAAADVWVFQVGGTSGTRITDSPGQDFSALWTPDGRELIYNSERPHFDIWRRLADASEPARPLIGGHYDRLHNSISRDGRLVAYLANKPGTAELMTAPLQGEPKERTYLSGVLNSAKPAFSPDGRWMVYESEESGRVEVYLQSHPELTRGRWKLSTNGGSEPLWTRNGREVVYRERDAVMAVPVNPDRKEIGAPHALFRGAYPSYPDWTAGRSYDATPDGERFLLMRELPAGQRRRIVVTLNWFVELTQKASQ